MCLLDQKKKKHNKINLKPCIAPQVPIHLVL